jgi:hypothetical protein
MSGLRRTIADAVSNRMQQAREDSRLVRATGHATAKMQRAAERDPRLVKLVDSVQRRMPEPTRERPGSWTAAGPGAGRGGANPARSRGRARADQRRPGRDHPVGRQHRGPPGHGRLVPSLRRREPGTGVRPRGGAGTAAEHHLRRHDPVRPGGCGRRSSWSRTPAGGSSPASAPRGRPMPEIQRQMYVSMLGPTTGSRLRLAGTDLLIESPPPAENRDRSPPLNAPHSRVGPTVLAEHWSWTYSAARRRPPGETLPVRRPTAAAPSHSRQHLAELHRPAVEPTGDNHPPSEPGGIADRSRGAGTPVIRVRCRTFEARLRLASIFHGAGRPA